MVICRYILSKIASLWIITHRFWNFWAFYGFWWGLD